MIFHPSGDTCQPKKADRFKNVITLTFVYYFVWCVMNKAMMYIIISSVDSAEFPPWWLEFDRDGRALIFQICIKRLILPLLSARSPASWYFGVLGSISLFNIHFVCVGDESLLMGQKLVRCLQKHRSAEAAAGNYPKLKSEEWCSSALVRRSVTWIH